MNQSIIIGVKDGVISLVTPLPEGIQLEIHDYDSAQAYLQLDQKPSLEAEISYDDAENPFLTALLDNTRTSWGKKPSVKTQPIPNNISLKEEI